MLGVCLVFLFGMIAGSALTIHIERARTEQIFFSGRLGSTLADRLTHRLTSQLNCDPRQNEEIRDILLDAQRDMNEARRQINPQLRQVFFRTADRVRGVLHGEQVKTFDDIMNHVHAHQASSGSSPIVPSPGQTPETKGPNIIPQNH